MNLRALLFELEFILLIQGCVPPSTEVTLTVRYFPGTPMHFFSNFIVAVAYFDPVSIEFFGESVYPSVCIDRPRLGIGIEDFEAMLCEAKDTLFRRCDIRNQVLESLEADKDCQFLKNQVKAFLRNEDLTCAALAKRASMEEFIRNFVSPV